MEREAREEKIRLRNQARDFTRKLKEQMGSDLKSSEREPLEEAEMKQLFATISKANDISEAPAIAKSHLKSLLSKSAGTVATLVAKVLKKHKGIGVN